MPLIASSRQIWSSVTVTGALLLGAGGQAVAFGTPAALPVASASAAATPQAAPSASLGTSLLSPLIEFRFAITSKPKGKQSVRVEVSTRQRGKAQYRTRLLVFGSGRTVVQHYARNAKGRIVKIGRAMTVLTGTRPGVEYVVQTSTMTTGSAVTLSTRMWPASEPTPRTWASASDRSRNRLTSPGSARLTTKSAKHAKARISGVRVIDLGAAGGSSGTPSQPPAPPVFPEGGTSGTRIVGSAGAAYSGSAPTVPPLGLGDVVPDSSIPIPAAPPTDGGYIFVSTSGSDTNPGTSRTKPVKTLPKAVSLVREGGFIVMLAGTYPAATNTVFVAKRGVTITSDAGARVMIDGTVPIDPSTRSDQAGLATFPYTQVKADLGEGHDLNMLPAAFENGAPTSLATDRGWACVRSDGQSYVAHGTPTADNPSGCASGTQARIITGYYPDQVWSAGRKLIQVSERAKVRPGRFFIDRSYSTDQVVRSTTLFLDPSDAADVRVSAPVGPADPRGAASLLEAKASDVRFNGIQIHGFAGPWWSFPVHMYGGQSGFRVTNVLITDASGIAVKITGLPTGLARDASVVQVRIHRPGWASVVSDYVTGLALDRVESLQGNADAERSEVSQLRIVKTHNTVLSASVVRDSIGHGVWFDQSCFNSVIVGNRLQGNSMSQLFYEFSHSGTIVGNLLLGSQTDPPLRLSGASETKLVNNTIIGGTEPVWIYTDPRAKFFRDPATGAPRSCADHPVRYGLADAAAAARDCNITTVTDYDYARPGAFAPGGQPNQTPGMNWRVSIAMMVNNVLGPSTGRNHCGLPQDPSVVFCIGAYTDFAGISNEIPLNEILPAGALIDGNIYQDAAMVHAWGGPARPGSFVAADVATLQAALSGPYFRMTNPEHHAQNGGGWTDMGGMPTAQLSASHAWAAPAPADPAVNAYVPAGARHYGAFLG